MRGIGQYIFRNWASDDFDGTAMANYLINQKITTTAIINQQTDYSEGLADAFEAVFKKFGGTVIIREKFFSDISDPRPLLVRVSSRSPKNIYIVAESQQLGALLPQARSRLPGSRFFANLSVDTPECAKLAGTAREGIVFTTPAFDPDNLQNQQLRQFVSTYKRLNGDTPDIVAGTAYDAYMILATGIQTVGYDAEKLAAYLRTLKRFPGVTGQTSFDETGDVVKNVFVKEIRNGQPTLLKEFTY
jgi:branched-chain amino acid transport system substrate-binding protein